MKDEHQTDPWWKNEKARQARLKIAAEERESLQHAYKRAEFRLAELLRRHGPETLGKLRSIADGIDLGGAR